MIYLDNRFLKIVKDILRKYPYKFYAYGSRVKGTHRSSSDLDICFFDNIPFNIRAQIEEDFEQSDLPIQVEVCDFNLMSTDFQAAIKKDLTVID